MSMGIKNTSLHILTIIDNITQYIINNVFSLHQSFVHITLYKRAVNTVFLISI